MAIQNRLMGWHVQVASIGSTVNLLQYFKDIDISYDCTLMEARVPHDTIVNKGAHYPRPKSRKLEITVSGVVPGEDVNAESAGVVVDSLFDQALLGTSGTSALYNADTPFAFNTPGLNVSGVGIVTGGDLDFPGDEAGASIKITARSYDVSSDTITHIVPGS